MSNAIVIVTCMKHRWSLEMFSKSAKRNLLPTRIFIIYNDADSDYEKWKRWFHKTCELNLKKHKVVIKSKRDYWSLEAESHLNELEKSGWVDQQVLKLAVAKDIKFKNYICLDSKNFFIKPTKIQDIPQIVPRPIDWTDKILENWVEMCCKELGLKYPGNRLKLTQNTTPYIIYKEYALSLIEHFGGIDEFYKWFSLNSRNPKYSPSEFFLYELWLKKNNANVTVKYADQNCASMWDFQVTDLNWKVYDFKNHFKHMLEFYGVKIGGIHKSLNDLLSYEEIKEIMQFIQCEHFLPTDDYR